MTRRAERRRRVGEWFLLLAGGAGLGWLALPHLGWPGAAAVFGIAALTGHRRMIAPPGVAILTYHSVSPDPAWLPWSRETAIHPISFAQHLDALAAMRASVIGTRELVRRRATGEDVPDRAVVLHFDDGYLDNHRHAAPLLAARGLPATFFPSLDFVEPDGAPRDGDEAGYMRWAELAELDACGFEIEPHGVSHARIATSPRTIGTLTAANWRHHVWLQWAATPGPKHDWFRLATPQAVPLGAAIPESGLALAARGWVSGAREDEAALAARIARDLTACRTAFHDRFGRAPEIFCWPENRVGHDGRRIAAGLGYRATTGGAGRNTAGEPPQILSRIHVGDRALGFRWRWAERLAVRAQVRLMHGNLYWYLLLAPMNLTRRLVFGVRARCGNNFA